MGLLQNGYRHNLIGRIVGPTDIDGWRPEVGVYQGHRTSANRNSLSEVTDNLSAIPNGNRHPSSWVMPNKAGGLSSRKATLEIAVSGSMLRAYPIEGSSSLTITTNTPSGELIVSGNGAATLVINSNSPILTASIGGAGLSTITVSTNTPLLGAIADLIASGNFTLAANTPVIFPIDDASPLRTGVANLTILGSLTPYAIGFMEGTTEEAGLTNAGIANSVWNSLLSNYTVAGSAGKALATASSGGVDLVAMAQAILDAAQLTPIHSNVKQMNSTTVLGTGVESDKWRGDV